MFNLDTVFIILGAELGALADEDDILEAAGEALEAAYKICPYRIYFFIQNSIHTFRNFRVKYFVSKNVRYSYSFL